MKDLLYLLINDQVEDIFVMPYTSLDEANGEAIYTWKNFTKGQKERYRVYVIAISKDNYVLVENEATDEWFLDLQEDIENTFNSDVAEGYGVNQEIAYMIFGGNDTVQSEEIYSDKAAAIDAAKKLHDETKKDYFVAEIGAKDAAMVKNELTHKSYEDFVDDMGGIYSTWD